MQYLALALASIASPNQVEMELMDARQGLKEFEEDDMKPLAGLLQKAKAAGVQGPSFGMPASLLQTRQPGGLPEPGTPEDPNYDPDKVDADGMSDSDRALKKEEDHINGMRTEFNSQWSKLGDDWDQIDRKEHLGKYSLPRPKFADVPDAPAAADEDPNADPGAQASSLAQVDHPSKVSSLLRSLNGQCALHHCQKGIKDCVNNHDACEQRLKCVESDFEHAQDCYTGLKWDDLHPHEVELYDCAAKQKCFGKADSFLQEKALSHLQHTAKKHRAKKLMPGIDRRNGWEQSVDELADFVRDQRREMQKDPQLFGGPSSFAETDEPQSEVDLSGLDHVTKKLGEIEARLRKHSEQLKDAEDFAKSDQADDAAPSSFAQTGELHVGDGVDFKNIIESLRQLRDHSKMQLEDLKTKGFFDAPPGAQDADLEGTGISLAQVGSINPAERVKKEVQAVVNDLRARGEKAEERKVELQTAASKLGQLADENRRDEEAADATLQTKYPKLVEAEQEAAAAVKAKDAKLEREAEAADSDADADPSSFIETARKPEIQWWDEARKDDFEQKQKLMDAEQKRMAGAVERMKHAHVELQKELKETQEHEKSHAHSKIYAKLRAIALGEAKPDHKHEPELRTDDDAA